MKMLALKCFSLILALILTHSAFSVEFMILPSDHQSPSSYQQVIQTLRTKKKLIPLFNLKEAQHLQSLGDKKLSLAFKVQLSPEEAIALKNKGLTVEPNSPVKLKQTNQSLLPEQWGLKNTGQRVKQFGDDYYSSVTFIGTKGIDIELPTSDLSSVKKTIVAVLDTGIDLGHPDFKNQIYTKPSECKIYQEWKKCLGDKPTADQRKSCEQKIPNRDSDNNGYEMDCQGYSFINDKNPQDVQDQISHGTHVSGIIAAQGRIKGVNPQSLILPIQVITDNPADPSGGGPNEDTTPQSLTDIVAKALLYAIKSKADVVNLSLGWNGRAQSQVIEEMIKLAHKSKIVVVAASGNDGTNALVFPCQMSGVICVGAHDPNGKRLDFSNHSYGVDILAPGVGILSTIPLDSDPVYANELRGYDFKEGTSMATPFVAGAASLLMAKGFSAEETKARLLIAAQQNSGRLSVLKALDLKPTALVHPLYKGVHLGLWSYPSKKFKVQIPLINEWANAESVVVKVKIEDSSSQSSLRLVQNQFTLGALKSNATSSIQLEFEVLDPSFSSEIKIGLQTTTRNTSFNSGVELIISTPIGLNHLPQGSEVYSLNIPEGYRLRNIQNLGLSQQTEYLAFKENDKGFNLQLLRPDSRSMSYSNSSIQEVVFEEPSTVETRTIAKMDLDFDGKEDYFITTLLPGPVFRMDFFDSSFKQNRKEIFFKNDPVFFNLDQFAWIKNNSVLTPAWIAYGSDLKEMPYDPWNSNATPQEANRLYFFDASKKNQLTALDLPEGYQALSLIDQDSQARLNGVVRVLATQNIHYQTAPVIIEYRSSSDKGRIIPIVTENPRNLIGLSFVPGILNHSQAIERVSSFFGASKTQSMRVTSLIPQGPSGEPSSYLSLDLTGNPKQSLDYVVNVTGVLKTNLKHSAYFQTLRDFVYVQKNLANFETESALTSLRRYSFLDSQIFYVSFYPTLLKKPEALSAIAIPDGFGAYPGFEMVVPMRNNPVGQTQSIELRRPTQLRLLNRDSNCRYFTRLDATTNAPAQVTYLCESKSGSKLIRAPLELKN